MVIPLVIRLIASFALATTLSIAILDLGKLMLAARFNQGA
jgi:hypothetical protein